MERDTVTSHTLDLGDPRDCISPDMGATSFRCVASTIQMIEKKKVESPQEKALRHWAFLRNAVHHKVLQRKLLPIRLTHGIVQLLHVHFTDPLRCVIYSPQRKGFVSLNSGGTINFHSQEGRVTNTFQPAGELSGLLHATHIDHYVAWISNRLIVLNSDLAVVSTTLCAQEVCCAVYNHERKEVIAAGPRNITIWRFRIGFRRLLCYKEISEGFDKGDVVSLLALEKASMEFQKCFAVCDNGIAVFNLRNGALIAFKRKLHLRSITGIIYSDVAKLLVTSSKDTSIKVWDENWHIRNIFVGHTAAVMALTLHHDGTLFFSVASDYTIRTWDLETVDQLNEVEAKEEGMFGLVASGDGQFLVSYSDTGMDLWQVRHIYDLYSMVGSPVTDITTTELTQEGNFPLRAVCVCKDSAVHLLAVNTGEVLSTLFLDKPNQAAAAEYCLPRETLFVLTQQGDILRVNTLTNPMAVVKRMTSGPNTQRFTCLALYSFITDYEAAFSYWTLVVEEKGESGTRNPLHMVSKQKEKNRYLLITGQEDGMLSVYDWYTWLPQCQVKAHESGKVTGVICSPENDCIISAGSDLTIKVWHVFPYAQECLSLEMTFYCAHPVVRMCTMPFLLIVAFQDPSTATFSIVRYNLSLKVRTDHHPGDDPLDEIIGLCCCPRLKVYASASKDGFVKIWSHKNEMVSQLNLSAIPESLAFCSNHGDLLVGIQRHIYRIHLAKFLPYIYRVKIACIELPNPVPDPPVPLSVTTVQPFSKETKKQLMYPRASITRSQLSISQSIDEEPEDLQEHEQEKEDYTALAARDEELLLMQQGKLQSSKKPKRTKETEKEAFESYLHLFYSDWRRIKIPEIDGFDAEELLEPPTPPAPENPYYQVRVKGFFPDPMEALNQCIVARMFQKGGEYEKLPIPPYGFIPNSVLAKALWPPHTLEERFGPEGKPCRGPGPCLTDEQKDKTGEWKGMQFDGDADRIWNMESEDEEADRTRALLEKIASVPVLKPFSSSFVSDLERVAEDLPITPSKMDEIAAAKRKDFKKALPPLPSKRPSTPAGVKGKSPPPPLPRPDLIPLFIRQFQQTKWFKTLFPHLGPETFPKDVTVAKFVSQLIQGLERVNFTMKVDIIEAIMLLYDQEGFENVRAVHDALIAGLNPKEPLNLQALDQMEFILATLKALKTLDCSSKELALELMAFFQEATHSNRTPIMILFDELGLQDDDGHFYKEMDSWETWKDTDGSKTSLKDFCNRWLNEWIKRLERHITKTLKGSKKGKKSKEDVCLDVSPMDAINYFCQRQREKALRAKMQEKGAGETCDKDTVLALPPIDGSQPILRLGETHSMLRMRTFRDFYLPRIPQPHLFGGRYINFPIKRYNLIPFPSVLDQEFAPGLIASLNQMARRYFYLEHSFAGKYVGSGTSCPPASASSPATNLREGYRSPAACSAHPHA